MQTATSAWCKYRSTSAWCKYRCCKCTESCARAHPTNCCHAHKPIYYTETPETDDTQGQLSPAVLQHGKVSVALPIHPSLHKPAVPARALPAVLPGMLPRGGTWQTRSCVHCAHLAMLEVFRTPEWVWSTHVANKAWASAWVCVQHGVLLTRQRWRLGLRMLLVVGFPQESATSGACFRGHAWWQLPVHFCPGNTYPTAPAACKATQTSARQGQTLMGSLATQEQIAGPLHTTCSSD